MAALAVVAAASARSEGGVTLRIWVMNNGAHPVEDMERIVQPFERSTGYQVDVELVGWDVQFQRITNAAISGQSPDITQAGTTQVAYFAALNGFENLQGRVGPIGGKAAYPGGVWTTTQVVGKPGVWSVPWFSEARTIYYRTDVFKRAGIDPSEGVPHVGLVPRHAPEAEPVQVPRTAAAIFPLGQPGKTAWDLVHHVMPFVWDAGGSELSADASRSTIAEPRAVTGVKYFADLANKGYVMPAGLEMNAPQVENLFKAGQLATWIGGPWVVAAAARSDDKNWVRTSPGTTSRVAQMPAGPTGKSYTFAGGSNLMLFKYSKHKNEAWQLMQFLSQPRPARLREAPGHAARADRAAADAREVGTASGTPSTRRSRAGGPTRRSPRGARSRAPTRRTSATSSTSRSARGRRRTAVRPSSPSCGRRHERRTA